jgi:hypothetical protein
MLTIAPGAAKAGRTTSAAVPNATAPADPAGPTDDPGQVPARIFDVRGRVVLVPGGASGLGLAIATMRAAARHMKRHRSDSIVVTASTAALRQDPYLSYS